MSSFRKLQHLWGRKRSCASRSALGVEQLESREVLSTISIQSTLVPAPSVVTVAGAPDTPNDPKLALQWDMQKIGVIPAWSVTTGSAKTVVAVLDNGVDYNHPDLFENIWINQREIPLSRLKNLKDVDHDGLITFCDLNNPVNQGPARSPMSTTTAGSTRATFSLRWCWIPRGTTLAGADGRTTVRRMAIRGIQTT
jgi:subtilisin family serine protease